MAMDDLNTLLEQNARLSADNRRLRRLLDQQTLPSELRHRLRNTMGLLRFIVDKTSERNVAVEDYAGNLLDRMDAIAHAQSIADELGAIDLHSLILDRLLRHQIIEGQNMSVTGPTIRFQPRYGQYLALAIHELATNAIEHGSIVDGAHVWITWSIKSNGQLGKIFEFLWKEECRGQVDKFADPAFGTEILTSMLSYQFDAQTEFVHDSTGYACAIRFLWSERFGEAVPDLTVV